ncbi:hypothetical protein L7F22_001927 [Adiantum nelumboides]|nr:hypothetical protein [Adiantum nelumboides]
MGYTAEAGLACPGHTEAVTPIIGKLRLHIQSYVDAEEFYIMPLDGCDVLLGIPWLFRVQGILDAYNKKITVQSRGKTLILDVKLKGESIPTVSASAISSVMKKHLSAYLVLHLPPERPEDHAIDLVPGSSPPNRPPYRVSAAQQKEIMSQVEELLEKGLIQPSSSPFCSPVLLVQKKDGSWPNLYRIKKAFRTGAHQLAQVFEVIDDDFPESLDGFFSNTWERHQSGPRPDAPTSYFPPFEKFVYEPGCVDMLGDACLFKSSELKTSGLLSTGKITEKDNSYRPDSVEGFTDVHHNRITPLACPVVLKTSVNTQSNLTCNMPIAVNTDSLLRTSSVRKANSDKGQSMEACKAPASFTLSDSERGHKEMLDSGMINNCGSPTTEQHIVVGESPLREDRLGVYKSGCSPVEGGQGAEMSSDGLHDFTLSKAASDTVAVIPGQGTENISFVRGKSCPIFTSRDSNKTSSGNTAISNNMISFSPFSALEKLIRNDTATQKPPDFLFPESRDWLYASFIPSKSPPVASSSSSTVTSSPFIQSSSFSELHGERTQDLACPSFMEAQPSKMLKDTFQEPASDDVQSFASPMSPLHAVTVPQMPSQHQVFEEQQPEQAWSQLHVNREQSGMSLFFLNNQASTLAETKGGKDGTNMKRGTSVIGHMAVPSEAQELSSTKSLDEKMHLRVGRLDKSIEVAHQSESTASTTSSCENLPTTASSWCHIFPTNGEVSKATIPDYVEGLSSVGAIAPQPFGNVDVFESDLFGTGMTKASSVQEGGNFVSQIPANWCSPTGAIPLVPYHNPYHSVFPPHGFSPQIPYEREVFLHRQKLPQIYSCSGQTLQSSASALSARYASLSAEESELQPSKDVLRSNLANHLQNLEFGIWCEEPALQPLSPMYHHAQDPYFWGVSPFLPLQGSCNQMVDSPKALVPVLIGGMPHVISGPVTSGVGHLQKQEMERGTFLPVINGMHKDLKPVSPHRAWQHELWHWQKKTHSSSINDTTAAPTLIALASCHDAYPAVTNVQAVTNTADEHGGMASHFSNLSNSFETSLPLVVGQLEFGSLGPIDITSFPCSRTGSKQS